MSTIRHDWKADEVRALFDRPLMDLVHTAQTVHREHHPEDEVQLCTLMSIKTGGCAPNRIIGCPHDDGEVLVAAFKLLRQVVLIWHCNF